MKKIISKMYDNEWLDSDLDYEKESKVGIFQTHGEDAYLNFRNAIAGINTYNIVKIEFMDEISSLQTKFRTYDEWDKQLNQMGKYFYSYFGLQPMILLANDNTLTKIDHLNKQNGAMTAFQTETFTALICVDNELLDDEYIFINDPKANII